MSKPKLRIAENSEPRMTPPKWIGPDGRKVWNRLIPDLLKMGILHPTMHAAICEIFCVAAAQFVSVAKEMIPNEQAAARVRKEFATLAEEVQCETSRPRRPRRPSPPCMKGDDMDDHEAARMLTLKQAVTDAAANRLSKAEVAEAIFASRIDRRRFDSLVAAERDRQAAARQQQDDELEQRRRHSASNRPLTPLYAERNDR